MTMASSHVVIVGAGPAGMAAAIRLRQSDLDVVVIDDASAPGGQIWRGVETNANLIGKLGTEYTKGAAEIRRFRSSGARYRPDTEVWRIDEGWTTHTKRSGVLDAITSQSVVLATGALERPMPFLGWTLPGVVSVGGAQTLLKNAGQVPEDDVWLAGAGPLILLYAIQIMNLGRRVKGILDTSGHGNVLKSLRHISAALANGADLVKGMTWMLRLRLAGVPVIPVRELSATGNNRLEEIRYETASGKIEAVPARLLLVHQGVVPNVHATLSLGCAYRWDAGQQYFAPATDEWGMTSRPGVYLAGDGAGIGGVQAASAGGQLAALGILVRFGRLSQRQAQEAAAPLRMTLSRMRAFQDFLSRFYAPRADSFTFSDETVICRCEHVTAGEIRKVVGTGISGPNRLKAYTRVGMGRCQGRQCALTLSCLIAAASGVDPNEVGHINIRPPLKPVTVGELARTAASHSASG